MPKPSCALCKTTWKAEGFSLFGVSVEENRLRLWSESCGITLKHSSKVCELHFAESDFRQTKGQEKRRLLRKDAVPMALDVLTSWDSIEEVFGKLDKATQARGANEKTGPSRSAYPLELN